LIALCAGKSLKKKFTGKNRISKQGFAQKQTKIKKEGLRLKKKLRVA
jgi:hypothetical protein